MNGVEGPSVLFTAGRALPPLPPFRPRFPWITGDLQTLRNNLIGRKPPLPAGTRLSLPIGDGTGDALTGALHKPAEDTSKPLVVLIHGLTGDEDSTNIVTSAAWHLGRGHAVLRLNLRGAGPVREHARAAARRWYHAGASADVRAALGALPGNLKRHGILIAGTSLGGNLVLKLLAEGCDGVIAGAAISAPIDLKASQLRIMQPRNAVYHRHLLSAMRADAVRSPGEHGALYRANARRIRSIYDFDDLVVAPANGFAGADDYYRRCSAGPMLDAITVPTLLIHAADDPWIPAAIYRARAWRDSGAALAMPNGGGHVGFHGADHPVPWHNHAIAALFDGVL